MEKKNLLNPGEVTLAHNLQTFRPEHSVELYQAVKAAECEKLLALALDEKDRLVGIEILAFGPLTVGSIPPKEIFRDCVLANAKKIALVSYRPGFIGAVSEPDKALAEWLIEAGKLLDIDVKSYIVLGNEKWSAIAIDSIYQNCPIYSINEKNLLAEEAAGGIVPQVYRPSAVIDTPQKVVGLARDIFYKGSGSTLAFLMDRHNRVVAIKGLMDPTPGVIIKECVVTVVSGFILCTSYPLPADQAVNILSAADAVDLTLIDAITVSPVDGSFKSFRKVGALPSRRGDFAPIRTALLKELQEQPASAEEIRR